MYHPVVRVQKESQEAKVKMSAGGVPSGHSRGESVPYLSHFQGLAFLGPWLQHYRLRFRSQTSLCLPLIRRPVMRGLVITFKAHKDNPENHPPILNLITPAQSLLQQEVTFKVMGMRTWLSCRRGVNRPTTHGRKWAKELQTTILQPKLQALYFKLHENF